MAYQTGSTLRLLKEHQAISSRRLWALRAVALFVLLNTFVQRPSGLAELAGMITGAGIVYYAGLSLLAVDAADVEVTEDTTGTVPPAEIESVFDDGVVTKRELQQAVDVSDTTFDDAVDWWQAEGREKLSESDNVEALDDGGYRWQQV